GGIGYYFYEGRYNALVPPPRPVRRLVTTTSGETQAVPSAAQADGPTEIAPLDPGALEDDPNRWQNPPPSPAPRSGSTPAGGAAPANSGSPAASAPNPPVFSLPTAIPLATGAVPIAIPTALPPLQLPNGFSIPGLT